MAIGREDIVPLIIIAIIVIIIFWIILWKFYERSATQTAFVRTGFLGSKTVINGGALVIPILNDVTYVNLNTLQIKIRRAESQAVTTQDCMKIDVMVNVYMKVKADKQGVANAARALGNRTRSEDALSQLYEGQISDALRSVAASMDLKQLHQERQEYGQKIKENLANVLISDGLIVESVSIAELDQTDKQYFNPNNSLDAEGLTQLTERIENRRMSRNEIEQNTNVSIKLKNLESEKQLLKIQTEEEQARLEQENMIAVARAETMTQITQKESSEAKTAELSRVQNTQEVELGHIESKRDIEVQRTNTELEIEKQHIDNQKSLEITKIETQQETILAEQKQDMALAKMTLERNKVIIDAEKSRSELAKAEELVTTSRELERIKRQNEIELANAKTILDKELARLLRTAETEHEVSVQQGKAITTLAQAETDAERAKLDVLELRSKIESEARRLLNEADNALDNETSMARIKTKLVENMADIIRESVRPMENIDSIKVVDVRGLGVDSATSGAEGNRMGNGGGGVTDQIVDSALRYRSQAPIVDALLKEVGFDNMDVNKFLSGQQSKADKDKSSDKA